LGMNDLKSWRRDKQRGKASSSSGAAPTRKGKDS
jgi:hypothetical protein